MGFVKVQKNKAYYKRLQTKYRRRREGKTDYYARRKMVAQAKDKYNTPKYRFVVRITNKRILVQVVYSTIRGDRVVTQASSPELEKFGVPVGFTNYAACYATGLLAARRTLDLVGMADAIKGKEEADAEEYHVEEEDNERRPFKCILDVGLHRTIPGSRVFGVLKGAVDGGLHIPHSIKKFPGAKEPDERKQPWEYDAEAHRERIMGNHVQDYMEQLEDEDPERYKVQFSKYIENDIEAGGIEDMYKECHSKIRENPKFEKDVRTVVITHKVQGNKVTPSDGGKSYIRCKKRSLKQRKNRVLQKKNSAIKRLMEGAGDDDDDEE